MNKLFAQYRNIINITFHINRCKEKNHVIIPRMLKNFPQNEISVSDEKKKRNY